MIIEIKSTDRPDPNESKKLERFLDDFPRAQAYVICLTNQVQQMGEVLCLPWQEGIKKIFE